MSDLLNRLRAPHRAYGKIGELRALHTEAADRIEQLERELAEVRTHLLAKCEQAWKMSDEATLRAMRAEAKCEELTAQIENYKEQEPVMRSINGLLAAEHMLRTRGIAPWKCVESECPYVGKPMVKHCKCFIDAKREHDEQVRIETAMERFDGGGDPH